MHSILPLWVSEGYTANCSARWVEANGQHQNTNPQKNLTCTMKCTNCNLVSGILFSLPLHPTLLPPCTNQVLETGSKNITVTKNEFVPFKFFTQIKPFHRIWGDTESINSIFLISYSKSFFYFWIKVCNTCTLYLSSSRLNLRISNIVSHFNP